MNDQNIFTYEEVRSRIEHYDYDLYETNYDDAIETNKDRY